MNQKETSHIHISSKEHLKRFNIRLPCFYAVPVSWNHCSSISYGVSLVPKTRLLFWVISQSPGCEDRHCPAQQSTEQEPCPGVLGSGRSTTSTFAKLRKYKSKITHTKSRLTFTPGTCWVYEKPLTTLHLHYRKTLYFLGTAQIPTQSSSSPFLEGGCGCPWRYYEKSRISLLCTFIYQYGQL